MHIKKLIDNGELGLEQRKGVVIPLMIAPTPNDRRQAQLALPVKWHPPDFPWIKLNTASWMLEESCQARGGGTIRDHSGQLLPAFSVPLSAVSPLEANAKTVRIGLSEAKELAHKSGLKRMTREWLVLSRHEASAQPTQGTSWHV